MEKVIKDKPAKRIPPVVIELSLLIAKVAAILLVMLLIFTFIFGIYRTTDAAMSPIVKDGDLILYYRLSKDYVSSDTLVLRYQDETQIRRVVATAGDEVDITEDGLLVNGAIQQEPNIFAKAERYAQGVEFPLVVGEGQVFVLGDSRKNATDSRVYGPINIEDTLGKTMAVLKLRNI